MKQILGNSNMNWLMVHRKPLDIQEKLDCTVSHGKKNITMPLIPIKAVLNY